MGQMSAPWHLHAEEDTCLAPSSGLSPSCFHTRLPLYRASLDPLSFLRRVLSLPTPPWPLNHPLLLPDWTPRPRLPSQVIGFSAISSLVRIAPFILPQSPVCWALLSVPLASAEALGI